MNDKREPISHEDQDEHRADVEYKRVKMKDIMQDVFGQNLDCYSRNVSWVGINDEKQARYDESRERLLSSPLLTPDLLKKTMVSKFIDMVLITSEDPFDSFCEVISHFKGISKEEFIKMDTDERAKILGESHGNNP